jgi:hypothetical protein
MKKELLFLASLFLISCEQTTNTLIPTDNASEEMLSSDSIIPRVIFSSKAEMVSTLAYWTKEANCLLFLKVHGIVPKFSRILTTK